jgi:hypothetical protein
MKIVALASAALLAAAPLALAQEDYDLASALADRGWYDLSQELFTKIMNAAALSQEERAEGKFGLARLKVSKAERADSTEEKVKLYDEAIKEMQEFLEKNAQHRRRGEALSDIGYLHQSKGKSLMTLSKADPARLDDAEKAYTAAEKLFTDLIAQLKKDEKKRPEDPKKDPAGMAAFEQWEEKMMFAKYNYATSLFAHAETYRDNPSKHPEMKRLLEQMNGFLTNDFMWLYEWYLLAYDAFIYMGRAFQLLAETSPREKSVEYWNQALAFMRKPKELLKEKENRKSEAIREICTRATLFQMKAYISYGDSRRGAEANKHYAEASKQAEELFRLVPNARFDEMGKAIRLEQARSYCKSGQIKPGIALLQDLAKQYKDTWVENVAVDMLGEYAGETDVALAVAAADNIFDRGQAFLYRAMQKYRKAIQAVKKPADQKFLSYCWYKIGECYYYLDRWYEAATALSMFEKAPLSSSTEAPKAAMLKRGALAKIARSTKDKADEKALDDFRAWLIRTYKDLAGDDEIRRLAVDFEFKQQFLEALKEWEKLARPEKTAYEEALFSIGFNLYQEGDRLMKAAAREANEPKRNAAMTQAIELWKRAQASFKTHLEHVDKLPTKDTRVVKNAIGSVLYSCKILVNPKIDRADEALAASEDLDKRFPNADPRLLTAIMSLRLDAKLKKGQVQEAEDDLRALKAKYEKERVGLDYYTRALALLANAFEEAANREKDKDNEKFELFADKAGAYYYDFYLLKPGEISQPKQIEAMAEKLFGVAESRAKKAGADKEALDRARDVFGKARELYNAYLLQEESRLEKGVVRAIKARITRCLIMTGKFDEAVKQYQEITRDDQAMRDGSSWESLADCYFQKAQSLPTGNERNGLYKDAEKIYAQLSALLVQSQTFNEHTWRLLTKRAETLYEIDLEALRHFYTNFDSRGYGPAWDENKWGFQTRLEDLRKKLNEKVPPRKQ